MDVAYKIRAGQAEEIIVAIELAGVAAEALSPEVILRERMRLDHRSHGAIEHEDALSESRPKRFFYSWIVSRGAHRGNSPGLD